MEHDVARKADPLEELEKKVKRLVRAYDGVKKERDTLRRKVRDHEATEKEMKGRVQKLERSRNAVKKKVDQLLGQLEKLERSA